MSDSYAPMTGIVPAPPEPETVTPTVTYDGPAKLQVEHGIGVQARWSNRQKTQAVLCVVLDNGPVQGTRMIRLLASAFGYTSGTTLCVELEDVVEVGED
jgi:hypothetical protein